MLLALLITATAATSPGCSKCPQHHHGGHHAPVPDADTALLTGGPPAPLRQLGAVPRTLRLSNGTLLSDFMENNVRYLLESFDVDHMLYHFRVRAGHATPPPGDRAQAWDTNLKVG